jgi:hypothetical protein
LHASDINDNGIYLSGSGETLIGNKTGNHIYYDGIGNLHIASDNLNITASDIDLTSNEFHLSTNNVIIDSDINNGLVSLGSNASANNISSFNGIYFDGNGNAAFGNNNTGEYITFNGNNIVISTNNFSVDSNGNVSASNA